MSNYLKYFNGSDETFSLQTLLGYSDIETLLRLHVSEVLSKKRSFEDTIDIAGSVDTDGKTTYVQIGKISILECFKLYKRLGLNEADSWDDYQCLHFKMQVVTENGVGIFGKHYGQGDHEWLVIYCPWLDGPESRDILYKEVELGCTDPFEWVTVREILGDYILNEGIYDDIVRSVLPHSDEVQPSNWNEKPMAFSVLDVKLALVSTSAALNQSTFKEVVESLEQLSKGVTQFIQDTIHTKVFYVESFWRDRGLVVLSHRPNSKNTPVFR